MKLFASLILAAVAGVAIYGVSTAQEGSEMKASSTEGTPKLLFEGCRRRQLLQIEREQRWHGVLKELRVCRSRVGDGEVAENELRRGWRIRLLPAVSRSHGERKV